MAVMSVSAVLLNRKKGHAGRLLFSWLLMTTLAFSARAAVLNVNDPSPEVTANGLCSLVEAIENANDDVQVHFDCIAGSGADTIVLEPLAVYDFTVAHNKEYGPTALPVVRTAITIEGRGATVQRNIRTSGFRLLVVREDGELIVNDLSLLNGLTDYPPEFLHYEDFIGSGVLNFGSLTIMDSEVRNNLGVEYAGGGIASLGKLSIIRSVIADNQSFFQGGGIAGKGVLTITASIIQSNRTFTGGGRPGEGGGGIHWRSGDALIRESTITNNSAFLGAGIRNHGAMTVLNSAIQSNVGVHTEWRTRSGGGVGVANGGILRLFNSTVSGNIAEGNASSNTVGGGLLNLAAGSLLLVNSTVVANRAVLGGNLYNERSAELDMQNSILAYTPGMDCDNQGVMLGNVANLIEDGSCNPDFTGDPLLGLLADNGGPTLTHAPQPLSTVVDNGDNAVCSTFPVDNHDQRGEPRSVDGNGDGIAVCDIGAYEVQETTPICDGKLATIYVDEDGLIHGGPQHGKPYRKVLIGTRDDDVILGTAGDDHIVGRKGADTICGVAGNDKIQGGPGDDEVVYSMN